MFSIIPYTTANGRDVFAEWLDDLGDLKAVARILARIEYMRDGHFGDCKLLKGGVWELRIDVGPGYRVYYSRVGKTIVLLLCGGDKRTQARDIKKALEYVDDYKRRRIQ